MLNLQTEMEDDIRKQCDKRERIVRQYIYQLQSYRLQLNLAKAQGMKLVEQGAYILQTPIFKLSITIVTRHEINNEHGNVSCLVPSSRRTRNSIEANWQ